MSEAPLEGFTDPRLPDKVYKTERGLNQALEAWETRARKVEEEYFAMLAQRDNSAAYQFEPSEARAESLGFDPGPNVPNPYYIEPQRPPVAPPQPKPDIYWARNTHYTPVRCKFDNGKEIKLGPRGTRGDCARLEESDFEDPIFNLNYGLLFEVIDNDVYRRVQGQQATNQKRFHPARDIIRTEHDKPITSVVVQPHFNEQGIHLGTVVDQGPGKTSQRREIIERAVAPARAKLPGTEDRPLPTVSGEIDPQDFGRHFAEQRQMAIESAVAAMDPEQAQFYSQLRGVQPELAAKFLADAVARQRGPGSTEGVEAGLSGFSFAGVDSPRIATDLSTRLDDGMYNPADRLNFPVMGAEPR